MLLTKEVFGIHNLCAISIQSAFEHPVTKMQTKFDDFVNKNFWKKP